MWEVEVLCQTVRCAFVSHIIDQDIFLATSVLCLYLQDVKRSESQATVAKKTPPSVSVEELRQQLTVSHKIWQRRSKESAQAGKVAKALSIVLGINESPVEDGRGHFDSDMTTAYDSTQLDDYGTMFSDQCKQYLRLRW